MLSRGEALALGSTTKLSFVERIMANYHLENIGAEIDTESILAAWDIQRCPNVVMDKSIELSKVELVLWTKI